MKNLKRLREGSGLSQQKLAEQLGTTSQQNIQKYEAGISEPDFQMLRQLADFFDTSVDYLIGHTGISAKVEKIERYALTVDEERFIEKLRGMSTYYQHIADGMLNVLRENIK